ncbi:hypothetical protein F4821DRAFT_265487 [Hypoxylon rubiginosum]|uniref:Uncharacterized protein n=1 Tax=Hypoxylon rubiginosum TaxID=110542 RepID=A0ACC0CKI0_9PEZI|nr:hypothetical protein F4821DRAFT_265487 [Hypoxylon rubiginosum]
MRPYFKAHQGSRSVAEPWDLHTVRGWRGVGGWVTLQSAGLRARVAKWLRTLKRFPTVDPATRATANAERRGYNPTVEHKIPEDFEPFNEELVLGYFENSKIGAHDDGEKEPCLQLGVPEKSSKLPPRRSRRRPLLRASSTGEVLCVVQAGLSSEDR